MKLKCPPDVDGVKLLWALAGNESSFGANAVPLHENAYCYRGKYFTKEVAELTRKHGCLAHCSYGPWQVLLINTKIAYDQPDPIAMHVNASYALVATVEFINKRIFDSQGAKDLKQIADSYNSGNFRDTIIPTAYIDKLVKNYIECPF